MAGTIELRNKDTFRLKYQHSGKRFDKTIKVENVINYKTDKRLQIELANFIRTVDQNNYTNTDFTYSEFCQIWIDSYIKKDCSPSVYPKYLGYLNNRILPFLGHFKLKLINVKMLKDYFNKAKTFETIYKNRNNNSISKGTFEKIYEIISGSLQKAFEWEYIDSNPCRRLPLRSLKLDRLPSELKKLELKKQGDQKHRTYNINTYNDVLLKLSKISSTNENFSKRVLIETTIKTGLCKSELAGLLWERDYNYKLSTLSIRTIQIYIKDKGWITKEPKAESRTRTFKIPNNLNNLLAEYKLLNSNNYIFFDDINFNSITAWWKDWQKNNNINPILTLHELRHTHASLMLKAGIDYLSIQNQLGHSDIKTTLGIYSHNLEKIDDSIANKIENL